MLADIVCPDMVQIVGNNEAFGNLFTIQPSPIPSISDREWRNSPAINEATVAPINAILWSLPPLWALR